MEKHCAYCGKIFQAKSSRNIYCKGPHFMTCPVCGKEYEVTNTDKLKLPPTACSYKCRSEVTKQRSLEKYGCVAPGNNPEARKKASETMMKNLGVPYAMMSNEVREKSKQTCNERYGVDNPQQNKEINMKTQETQIERYGKLGFNLDKSYEHRKKTVDKKFGGEPFGNPEIQQKIKDTLKIKYGEEHQMHIPEVKSRMQETLFKHYGVYCAFKSPELRKKAEQTMLERYGVRNASHSEELVKKAEQTMLRKYGKYGRISKINLNVSKQLEARGIHHTLEKCIQGKWFDICIPDQNIVLEINPSYTHNVYGNHYGMVLPHDYHLAKTNLAIEQGYRCIHIFNWDNLDKILSWFSPKINIDVEYCQMLNLHIDVANQFLEKYDIKGKCGKKIFALGLTYYNKLVQVMVFGKPEYNHKHSVEVLRICSHPNYNVIGGAKKMFQFATQVMELEDIIAYCDISKFTSEVFEDLGMEFQYCTRPHLWWSKDSDRINDDKFLRCKYERLFHKPKDEDKTDEEMMVKDGWLPVYDCGTAMFLHK